MNKEELIKKVSRETFHPQWLIKKIIDTIIKEIKETTNKEEKVTIKNFGTFEMKELKEQQVTFFNSGKLFDIPTRKRMRFRVSKNF